MNREPQTPSFDPASDGDRRPRRHRGRRPRRAMVIGGTVGLIAVVGGGYGVAQSLSGGGETRASAPTASEPAADPSTEPLKDRSSVGEAAPSASGTHSASPSASASKAPEKGQGKGRSQEKQDQAEAGTEAGAEPDDRAAAKTGEAPSTGRGNGSGSGSGNNGSGGNRKPVSGGGGTQAGGANSKYVQQIVDMVNAERAKAGCSPLTVNAKLQAAAQGHSDDMAARDYYDHTSPEGKSPGDRMTAAGYHWSTYGENIFKSPQDARTAMDGWMKSSGHRANILNCSFKEIGVGINFKSNGPWWTQNFGASS
ncbi:CAP domain-containing protein [Streptomyces sp. VNUA116]|uniref:CAP domain-containing protein n=1 Tax=Streptomyces sp. VNUA116 TaxID=3062449 RepID=UPI002676AF3C|nr:CAP domain-containing protein [Streptomyces sp. VNUA116]WKU43109.1 CAP domain-containing protein [Streptomyces sp. VNUA116]